jgi:hypothetical protein
MKNTKWLRKSLLALLFPECLLIVLFIKLFKSCVRVAESHMESEKCLNGETFSECVKMKIIPFAN